MLSKQEYLDKWNKSEYNEDCVIRVTNKCNETCDHCCFRSSPTETGQLSVETCLKINEWAPKNVNFNIMGGEFSILHNYPDILVALCENRDRIRLTTNGAWGRSEKETNKFFDCIDNINASGCVYINITISTDRWHEPLCHKAVEILQNRIVDADWCSLGDYGIDDLTPVGRAWDNKLIPEGPVQCFCATAPSLIITEDGMIHKCPFAYFQWKHFSETTWQDAKKYVWDWRATELAGGMTCVSCMESIQKRKL